MLSCGRLDRANSKTMIEQAIERLWVLGPTALVALVLSFGLMLLLRPWLERYAMVQPNDRSSHYQPTPQGGGIAAVIAALPNELQILPQVPWSIERACLLLAGVWFVNLVNFMDGIDWMTVAEFVPVTGAIVLLGLVGAVESLPALVAAALVGAMIGFAPFNRPVAQIFLGDVGSLPIGLLLGWLLVELAAMGHLAAAFILPLYYLADATITLALRIVRGEAFWQAHRTHFYQRATDYGLAVREIVTRVFLANLALAALALVTVVAHNIVVSLAMLSASAAIILWLLAVLAGVKNRR